ncbi:MAG: glycine cleavage system protein GcvH [Candidatus Sumerlaeia bacterium]|nr:glycine cleavage system protein GcvH [Candidatus Sumerlaeia bacterium]
MAKEKLLYTDSHEWMEPEGDVRRVGISEHAQHLLGDIVYTDLPEVGMKVEKGDEILVVESPKAAADVYAPVSGEIVEVNTALESDPSLVNKEPHDGGWLVKIRPFDPAEQEKMMSWNQYQDLIGG